MNLKIIFKQNRYSHKFVASLCAALVCPALFLIQTQIPIADKTSITKMREFSAPFFKFVTIGYWPAAVDLMWIQALQIVGEKNHTSDLIPSATSFYEMATDLDPRFYELFEQAGVMFSFILKSPDTSIHFLEKGIKNASPIWQHPYTLNLLAAYLYSYEKNDWLKAKEKYLEAAEIPGAPAYLKNMRLWLEEDGSEKKLAKRVLNLLIQQTTDDLLRSQYLERLKSL